MHYLCFPTVLGDLCERAVQSSKGSTTPWLRTTTVECILTHKNIIVYTFSNFVMSNYSPRLVVWFTVLAGCVLAHVAFSACS